MTLGTILRNGVMNKLTSGRVAISMSVRLISSVEIPQILKTCGFDGFYIDLEHSSFDYREVSQICIASLGAGATVFVRVPGQSPDYILRSLEAGAAGVIIPDVTSEAVARNAVAMAKYPPIGRRSVSTTLPQLQYRRWPADEVANLLNANTTIVAMIESEEGLRNVDAIAAVPGIDVLLIGTNDLCADMGLYGQPNHPRVRHAYERVAAACKLHGKHLGAGGVGDSPALAAEFVKLGARFLMAGTDTQIFVAAAQERVGSLRALLHDAGLDP